MIRLFCMSAMVGVVLLSTAARGADAGGGPP